MDFQQGPLPSIDSGAGSHIGNPRQIPFIQPLNAHSEHSLHRAGTPVQIYIQGGKTYGSSPLLATPDAAANLVRASQAKFRGGEITSRQGFADTGAADAAVFVTYGIQALYAEPLLCAHPSQQRKISLAPLPETEIITHIQVTDAQTIHKHLLYEILRRQCCQPPVEFEQYHPINAAITDMNKLFAQAGQSRRRLLRLKKFHGLRFEKNDGGGHSQLFRPAPQGIENRLMTKMHPIKITNGGGTTFVPGAQIMLTTNKLHTTD